MKVSAILAVYNGEKTLKETIGSILNQTYKGLELIVVDDGSTDKSAEIIKSIKDPRIKYFYQKNSGSPSAPRNLAIKKSTGDFIALCDQDDVWYPEKLEKQMAMVESLENENEVGVVISSADLLGNKFKENIVPRSGFVSAGDFFVELMQGNFITTCSAIIPKKVIEAVGDFDESQVGVDDYDLWIRISEKYGYLALSEKLCAWRYGGDSLSASKHKLYLENEKIFARLEKEMPESEQVKIGHGRNLNRIMTAAILEDNNDLAQEYAERAHNYPVSTKGKVVSFLYRYFPKFITSYLKNAEKRGKISL